MVNRDSDDTTSLCGSLRRLEVRGVLGTGTLGTQMGHGEGGIVGIKVEAKKPRVTGSTVLGFDIVEAGHNPWQASRWRLL